MADRTPSTPRFGPFNLSSVVATPTPVPSLLPGVDTHPVEVVGRIREHPDGRGEPSVFQALPNGRDLRIMSKEHQQGYRVFSLDGVSKAEVENLEAFYLKYAEARVEDVKLGGKCTIIMYGPTGAGKSHTMFGSGRERGVAYHALIQIMGESLRDESGRGQLVKATVWEIFNEDIYDLLAQTSNPAGSMKGQTNRVKLDVKGKKVRNSTCINDCDPNKLLKEIQKVEKRRVTKSTNCNDRSSRSHCVVTFEVPAVDGRLVLVDMAGSENIEQAGVGMDSKMQTGKINQGNGALKRVVEAIANGENHIPYRDSKLTMILQESFEDKNAKVLMILCASPDPRDLYKTLGTFEYGAKAKRIVRLPNSPAREKAIEEEQQKLAVVNAKDVAKDACIVKLRREKERSDKERDLKEKEVNNLRKRVDEMENQMTTRKDESDIILHEYRRQADLDSDHNKRRVQQLEEQLQQTERELEFQRSRAEKAESELNQLKRISFSNLENNPESADWGSMKQHSVGAMVKVESPVNRGEKIRGLGPLTVQDNNKSSLFGTTTTSSASPREKKEKKFSSSVLSFFKGSDSSHSSKKSSHGKVETRPKESPHQPLPSPKSEKSDKKRQAGQEAPSPKTAEKKRHTGQDAALTAITWQPSTLQELLKVKEEQVRESGKLASPEDAHHSWIRNLASSSFSDHGSDSLTTDIVLSDVPHVLAQSEAVTTANSPPKQEQISMSNDDDFEDISRQSEKDPLGLGTWSESKLHRKGWLPIIMEEKEEELERLGRKSLDEAAHRMSVSCPRFRDGSHVLNKVASPSSQNPGPSVPSELPLHNFFPSNLLRDKFSPVTANDRGSRMEHEFLGGSRGMEEDVHRAPTPKEGVGNTVSSIGSSPADSFLQRLGPSVLGAVEFSDRLEPGRVERQEQTQQTRDDPPVMEAASARKARIENIFLLCGHRREMAARTGAESPLPPSIPASPTVRENNSEQGGVLLRGDSLGSEPRSSLSSSVASSPLRSFRERDNQSHLSLEADAFSSPARSPFRQFGSMRSPVSPELIPSMSSPLLPVLPSPQKSDSPSRHRKFRTGNLFQFSTADDMGSKLPGTPESSLIMPSIRAAVSSPAGYSLKMPTSDGYADENNNVNRINGMECDVYVKWESKDTTGKFICVLKFLKGASLADLRREILPHVPNALEGFAFLMLGDTGGAPVESELEPDLRVGSLPDCPTTNGGRLASLRPPHYRKLYTAPSRPFRPIENTISANSSEIAGPNSGKLVNVWSGPKPGNFAGIKPVQTITGNNNSSSLVKGLRTLATGVVGLRGGQSLKDKGSYANCLEIASQVLN